jgi:transposase-like protein
VRTDQQKADNGLLICVAGLSNKPNPNKEVALALNTQEVAKLRRIVSLAETLIAKDNGRKNNGVARKHSGKRIRRTGPELVQFRKMIKAERKNGVPVSELARKHGISSAYIYMLP